MTKWMRDVIYGVAIAAISLFLIRDTYNLQESFITYESGRAGPYSRFWLWILLALSVVMIVRALLHKNQEKTEAILNPAPWVTVVLLSVYLFILTRLGFIVSTVLYLIIAMVYYSYKSGTFTVDGDGAAKKKNLVKHIVIILVCAIAVTVVTYYLFTEAVGVRLPEFSL